MQMKMTASLFMACFMMNLTACQSPKTSTKMIAGVFNASTNIQQRMIDKHAPNDVLVQTNIPYMQNPNLHLDLYQPKNIAELGIRPTIVWIHGGGWVSGSKEHARGYFKLLADQG